MSTQTNQTPIGIIVRENGKMVILYGLGALLIAPAWWPLAIIYLAYCLFSTLLFIRLICPYCYAYHNKMCPNAYHALNLAQPQKGKKFEEQFNRYVPLTYLAWFLPPAVGIHLLITNFSWPILLVLGVYSLFAFVLFPILARHVCTHCPNAKNCPRHSTDADVVQEEGA